MLTITFKDKTDVINCHVPVDCLPTDQKYKVYFTDQDCMTTDLNDVNDKLIMWG